MRHPVYVEGVPLLMVSVFLDIPECMVRLRYGSGSDIEIFSGVWYREKDWSANVLL